MVCEYFDNDDHLIDHSIHFEGGDESEAPYYKKKELNICQKIFGKNCVP